MKSLYGLLRDRCGLSLREAAAFHRVPLDTVTAWSSGRRRAPAGVIEELRSLYETIENAADHLIAMAEEAEENGAETIEIGLASDDHEAQSIGWPCVGAQGAAIGLAAVYVDVKIVPRGTTAATAAAVDAHERRRCATKSKQT